MYKAKHLRKNTPQQQKRRAIAAAVLMFFLISLLPTMALGDTPSDWPETPFTTVITMKNGDAVGQYQSRRQSGGSF